MNKVKGYKVFNPDWTCRGKKYTCPGKFEEEVVPCVCYRGMHFCKKAADCFNYYSFKPENHVAEVIGYGEIVESADKYCTEKLEILREISWNELLEIVNTGRCCKGFNNSGNYNDGHSNSGNYNSGRCNSGNRNYGSYNSGNYNNGSYNSGNYNNGSYNSGNYNNNNLNTGDHNCGDYNSGNFNSGNYNSGNFNSGNWNSGDWNSGNRNSGNCNRGNYNSGNYNIGNKNNGDWNECKFSNGCFNTIEPKINLFNKPSEWTYSDWRNSDANLLLNKIPNKGFEYVSSYNMTDEEKEVHPEAETTKGYFKKINNSECANIWWCNLSCKEKNIIMSIPNFDKDIFERITGINIDEN